MNFIKKISFIILLLTSCEKEAPQKPIVEVETYLVDPQTIPATIAFVGVAKSSHLVEIRSRVEGYLWKIEYTEGAFVNEGDPLFQIDPRQFVAQVDEAKGDLARQEAVLWDAKQAVNRFLPLYEQKAASKRDLDNATARELASLASVEIAKANLYKAELNLSYTNITSPISGMTDRSIYREGTLITPSINGLLTSVSVVDPIWVLFSVSDSYLLTSYEELTRNELIFPENDDFDVSLTLSDGTTFPYLGKVNFASPVLDQETGTMMVRAIFPNPNKTLRPGQFVRAEAIGAKRPNAIIVPQTSVLQGARGMFVYVVDKQSKAQLRAVEVGDWYEDYWIIKSGLQKGDQVIITGINKIVNGSLVKVISNHTTNQDGYDHCIEESTFVLNADEL